MKSLVIVRHGQSESNFENRFTGWTDVDLTEQGSIEAHYAGKLLRQDHFQFDVAFTSVLKRAVKTLNVILDEMDLNWIPVHKSWRLNERHYGALEGLNKAKTAEKYSREGILQLRRGFAARPPAVDESDPRHPVNDPKYVGLIPTEMPNAESLKDTYERLLPYWNSAIRSCLLQDKRVLIVAHSTSLRALMMHLESLSEEAVARTNIPTAMPRIYNLDQHLRPIGCWFHREPDEVQEAIDAHLARLGG